MSRPIRHPGSFRDPSGQVHLQNGRVFRTLNAGASQRFDEVVRTGFLDALMKDGWLVGTKVHTSLPTEFVDPDVCRVLEHEPIPFISYPYEWSFSLLKAAALFHLDLHVGCLKHGLTLSDASAYNVQFRGIKPVFIDVLSIVPYQDGRILTGHRQFNEQFLNPLLLRTLRGVPHNEWYRGALEGIRTQEIARLLPLASMFNWRVLGHVMLPARLERRALKEVELSIDRAKRTRLSKESLNAILTQLRHWIERMEPLNSQTTVWGDYGDTNTYADAEKRAKQAFIVKVVATTQPHTVLDLGCNTGEYGASALGAGAERIVGFDFDQLALERSFLRASEHNLDFLPLFLDAANPSPDQGWRQLEREGFRARANASMVMALAFMHHLIIGRNIPLVEAVEWLTSLAPVGVIEFVQKDDPTVQRMLALREDIFPDYSETAFAAALERHARVVATKRVSETNRMLYWFERSK